MISGCSILKNINQLSQIQKSDHVVDPLSKPATLVHQGQIPIIHLYGTPEEMGRQYGTILKPQLKSLYSLMVSVFPKKKLEGYIYQAKKAEPALPAEVKSELKAISEASGIEYQFVVAMNVIPRVDCSTLAAWGESTTGNELLMGRNAEYYTKGLNKVMGIIVVRHPDSGLKTINISYLGMVGGFTGMNEKGVCWGNMLAYNGHDDSLYYNGLSIQLLMRLGGEQSSTCEEFRNFLQSQNHIIPIIVMVANQDTAFVTEHTKDFSDYRIATRSILASANLFHTQKMAKHVEPDERYSILLSEARKHYGNLDVNTFEKIMAKASQKNKNVQCVIFEPSKMQFYVSMNKVPASEGPFSLIDANSVLGLQR
jgi:predicted choloylglycine hydrolase